MKNELRGYMVVRRAAQDGETHKAGERFLDGSSFCEDLEECLNKAVSDDNIIRTAIFEPPPIVAVIPVSIKVDFSVLWETE